MPDSTQVTSGWFHSQRKPHSAGVRFRGSAANALTASALPATQGIYGFVGFFMWLLVFKFDFAANGPLLFAMGLGMGIVCLFSAIRQGQVCANGIIGISQGHDVQTNTFIYAALPEFYAILGLAGVLMLALAI